MNRLSRSILLRGLPALLVLLLLWGWLWRGESGPSFATEAVRRGDVEATGMTIGNLHPRAEIGASLPLATVEADRAALDGLRAQLEEQQAQFDLAQQQHQRQQRLAVDEATREEDVQVAAASLKAAQARLKQLRAQIAESQARLKGNEAQLSYTRLYAPIAGTVLGVDVKQGQTLNATYQTPTVLRIADLSAMTAWTKVSEADIRQLKPR